jgi:hypothetical protein
MIGTSFSSGSMVAIAVASAPIASTSTMMVPPLSRRFRR